MLLGGLCRFSLCSYLQRFAILFAKESHAFRRDIYRLFIVSACLWIGPYQGILSSNDALLPPQVAVKQLHWGHLWGIKTANVKSVQP